MISDIRTLIRRAPGEIRRGFIYRTYLRNTCIFPAPGQTEYLYIIDSGVAEVIKESCNGAIVSVNVFTENALLGENEQGALLECRFT